MKKLMWLLTNLFKSGKNFLLFLFATVDKKAIKGEIPTTSFLNMKFKRVLSTNLKKPLFKVKKQKNKEKIKKGRNCYLINTEQEFNFFEKNKACFFDLF